MMKKMLVAATLAAVGSSAMAVGGYVEASAGISHVNQTCPEGGSCKSNKPAFRVLGGFYHLNPMVTAEVGYLSFGRATAKTSTAKASLQSTAIYTGLAVRLPVDEDIGLTFRLGGATVTSQLKGGSVDSAKSTRTNLLWGVGGEWKIDGKLSAMVAMDVTKTADPAGGGRGALSMVSAGLRYDF